MWMIFLIVIGLLIYFFVRVRKTKDQSTTQGEITRDEYERMKKDLEG